MYLETSHLTWYVYGQFFSYARMAFSKSIDSLLIGGCGKVISAYDGWNHIWEQFWAQQAEETEIRIHLWALTRGVGQAPSARDKINIP